MDRSTDITRVALLDNPIRAALYRLLVDRDDWVGRDEAADRTAIPRPVAAFHLDKLSEAGLVDVRFVRTSGRTGPGAGRPSKLYRRAEGETTVNIPERRYTLMGHLLAEAVEESARTKEDVNKAVVRLAKRMGKQIAATQSQTGGRRSAARRLIDALTEIGYEPRRDGDDIVLRNCPFHELAQQHTDLICGMNVGLVKALVEGITDGAMTARLDPAPGFCCVRIFATR